MLTSQLVVFDLKDHIRCFSKRTQNFTPLPGTWQRKVLFSDNYSMNLFFFHGILQSSPPLGDVG